MAHPFFIRQNDSPWPAIAAAAVGMLLVFLLWGRDGSLEAWRIALGFALLLPALVLAWAHWRALGTLIRFDRQTNEVSVEYRTLFGAKKRASFPLSSYNRVASYLLRRNDTTQNWVVLVSVSERTYVHLVNFWPASASKGFWSFSTEEESDSARVLRERLCADFELIDLGYLKTYVPEKYRHVMF